MRLRQPLAVVVGNRLALRDAQKGIVRLVEIAVGKIGVVGRHKGKIVAIGEIDKAGLTARLVIAAMTHQLDIKPAGKRRFQLAQRHFGSVVLALGKQSADRSLGAASQANEAIAVFCEIGDRHRWFRGAVAVEKGVADQGQQIAVSGLALHQHDQPIGFHQRTD